MAQTLLASGSREISLQSVEAGDLIFFERMSFTHKAYMIAHVGIMVSSTEFFHSSLHFA
jgi:cell wall-associated NlpC family hydrolase